jgi:hypothetical protein
MNELREQAQPLSVVTNDVTLMERRLELAQQIATKLAASNLVPEEYRGRPDDCFVAVQMGAELGMGPFQAVQSISVINGRPALWGDGLLGVVRASKKCEYIRESFDPDTQTAICETKRVGDEKPILRTFSRADAVKAGLIGSKTSGHSPWAKYEARMLQMRARSWCLRDAYADVLRGLSSAEELMDVENDKAMRQVEDDRVIEAEAVIEKPPTLDVVLGKISSAETMEELLKAGDTAKKLWAKEDQAAAREAYRARRAELTPKEETEEKEPSNAES